MDILTAILLGMVQGLAEFLPISSSGHLVLFQKWLGVEHHDLAFDTVVHLGTLFSVLTVYRSIIFRILKDLLNISHWRDKSGGVRLFLAVVIATIPTGVIGVLFKSEFEELFTSIQSVAILMMVTGGMLFMTRWLGKKSFDGIGQFTHIPQISFYKAFFIGVLQSLAIAPGISRSGTTIVGGLALGEDGKTAALFSFLLAIPAILGAAILQLKDLVWTEISFGYLAAGLISSYLTGLLGLWLIIRIVGKGRLEFFAFYLWVLGVTVFFL